MKRCKARKPDRPACHGAPKWSQIREIREAHRHLLGQLVPGDELGRTYAEFIAAAVIARAMHGDLKAVREIRQATEKHVGEKQGRAAPESLVSSLSLEDKIKFLQKPKCRKEVASYGDGRGAATAQLLKSHDVQSPSSRDGSVPDQRTH
jgi:hypothetical protein